MEDRIAELPPLAEFLDLMGGLLETHGSRNERTQGTSPLGEGGDPGRIRTCDPQLRRLGLNITTSG
jgi:hypothetical protein